MPRTSMPGGITCASGTQRTASYDPTTRELHLFHDAEINHQAPGPRALPMKIEAGELTYKEAASLVWLTNGARLTRQNTVVNAKAGIVKLDYGVIRQVDAVEVQLQCGEQIALGDTE